MKKNVMMRLAAILLVCVLASTCGISGTYAKYVSSEKGSDDARVAKWGVEVAVNGSTFEKTYATDAELSATAASRVGVNSVVAGEDVVAPGTDGSFAGVTITGTPEVAVHITYDVTKFELTNWEVGGVYYCPIIITVNGTDINGLDFTNAGDFKNAVIAAIEDTVDGERGTYYAAGTNLATAVDHNLSVTWKWNFEKNEGAAQWQSDVKDTALGNAANAKIDIEISCIVEQVD